MTIFFPHPGFAVNGVLSVRGNHQEGRTGAFAYSSDNIHYTTSLDERIRLAKGLSFRGGYLHTWETRDNQVGSVASDFSKGIQRPQMSLSYATSRFRSGWSWYVLRTEQKNQGVTTSQDDRFDNSLWASLELGRGNLESRWQGGSVERKDGGPLQENTDRLWSTSAQYRLSDSDQVQYGFSHSSHHAVTLGSKNIYDRHSLEYQGHRRFARDKGRVSLAVRSNFFRQQTIQEIAGSLEYLEPVWTGYALDDTPDFQDPMELDPVLVGGLSDNNLDASTGINIGDSGQLVREFGGDYRNLIFDFGDSVEIVAANLYIDIPLVLPQLMQWMVFVNDDPDGREWGMALGEDQVTFVYQEWPNGRQGWEIRFAAPISQRRLKLVNFKLGTTEPDIFITELEMFRAVAAQEKVATSSSNRHRISGTAGYQLNPDLHFNYGVTMDLRRFDQEGRNSTGIGQVAGFDWMKRGWMVAGSYQDSRRKRDSDTDTDINSQSISATPRKKGKFHTRFSAGRSQDQSHGRDLSSYNLATDTTWEAAPRLSFSQRVGYGYRQDAANNLDSHSWALISRVRSSPRRMLRVDVTRRDRWVSQEAGYGFMTFNDTEGLIAWSVTNQISASSRIRYQVRDKGEWVLRHFLSWSPVPGGNLEMRLFLNAFRDTRNDSSQLGQGISVTWHPRSRLFFEGGYNVSEFHQGDEESSPQNLHFRGTWSF